MADKKFLPKQAHNLKRYYVDRGDGTWAEVMVAEVNATIGDIEMEGKVADGAAVGTTKPVLIGGQDGTNAQSARTDTTGNLGIYPKSATGATGDATADNQATPVSETGVGVYSRTFPFVFNGVTWDRLRGSAAGGMRVHQQTVSTATLANVNDSASSVTLQAANTARLGWSCFNDSDQILYIKFGATASATSFTVKVAAGGYYEMPTAPVYTGVIDGIWAADSTGAARVTELTA